MDQTGCGRTTRNRGSLGAPWQYRFGWYEHSSLAYAALDTPRYSHESQVAGFEANLYGVADGQLVWSALSQERLGPADMPGALIEHFVRQLVSALRGSRGGTRSREHQ